MPAYHLTATVPVVAEVRGTHAYCNSMACVLEAVGPDGSRVLATGPFNADYQLRPGERLVVTVRG